MGSVLPFGGGSSKTGGSSSSGSSPGNIAPLGNELENIAGAQTNIAGQESSVAQPFLSGGTSQYEAGLTGQLTPAQQALTSFTNNQMNTGTASTYANLGLGGSTMQTQDINANDLASLAQQEQIDFQNEQMGMYGATEGGNFLNNAISALSNAGGLLTNAGNVYNSQQQQNQQTKGGLGEALGALSGNSAGTSGSGVTGTGSLFSGLTNLFKSFGGSGGSSATGTTGSSYGVPGIGSGSGFNTGGAGFSYY